MDYKNKYLKYKNKYLEIKNQNLDINQFGSGKQSHRLLDPRIYKYIGTYETKEERETRERANTEPVDGYKIWNSIYEIIRFNYGIHKIDKERIKFIDLIFNNLNELFGISFFLIEENGSELFYIDARGDGNCFLNSLYIYTFMTGKTDIINTLYSMSGIRESNLVNFDDFKQSMLFLSDSILDSKIDELGEEFVDEQKREIRHPDIPSTQTFGQLYTDNFNTRIMVIQIDSRYKFVNISARFEPETPNDETDNLVIIQKENIHFGLLVPSKNDFRLRKLLFDYLNTHLKNFRR